MTSMPSSEIRKVNLQSQFALIPEPWKPRIAGEVNETWVKLVKLRGEFVWHFHEHEDELFLVIKGRLLMKFRDREIWIEAGEFLVVPRGVEHLPVAPEVAHVVLVEPKTTLNTGNLRNERTVAEPELI